ncbi:MAG: carboxypeptidase M32 [Gemmataceae bacterium]
MSPTPQEAYDDLISRIKERSVLESSAALLGWDMQTFMPRNGSAHRGAQLQLLAKMGHAMLTAPEMGELLDNVEGSDLTNEPLSDAAVNVREIRRSYDRATKLPSRLVEELAKTTSDAYGIWQEARQENSFEKFRPSLEKIVDLKREEAQAIGYDEVPYDALLDEFEPGVKTKEITDVFSELQKELVPLIGAIAESAKKPDRTIFERSYPIDRQNLFSQGAAAAVGFDFLAGRLDVTVHPFCSGIGPGDCRLTTRYHEQEFNQAFFGTLHEAGHGMYEQGLPPEHFGTPRGTSVSMGIHESQSRMWENQVGRSRPFWEHFYPRAQQMFPNTLAGTSLDDFYFALNDVKPLFIRVESDEATYNLHIILRFEIEQALISGELQVADVPSAWNEKFHQFFQLTPPNDAQGCLQDVHWSTGGFGYFPTYSLGNLFSAQFMEKAYEDIPDLDDQFRRGRFQGLKDWLGRNIHERGQQYRATDLCETVTGQPLSHQPLIRYLKEKYGPLYGLT